MKLEDEDCRSCAPDDLECEDLEDWLDEAEPVQTGMAPAVLLPGKDLLSRTYNRLGGVMAAAAAEHGLDVAAVLAVWRTESGPFVHKPGEAIIRFENHIFHKLWGKGHPEGYAAHYRHDKKKGWLNHQFRPDENGEFAPLHVNQKREYAAMNKAAFLADTDTAYRCISIGGPQILCRHYELLGYESPRDMYLAFQTTEDVHVRGFFAFCESQGAIAPLKAKDWKGFARIYNGSGQAEAYGAKIRDAYNEATNLLTAVNQ